MNRTQKIALRGMLIAVAFVLSWLEAQLPPLGMVPGIKLGLTNLVVLVAIYRLGTVDAMVINGIRILLVAFTFGNHAAKPQNPHIICNTGGFQHDHRHQDLSNIVDNTSHNTDHRQTKLSCPVQKKHHNGAKHSSRQTIP